MKVTKYGHCCFLVEEGGVRLLTDPGAFSAGAHASLTGIDVILYTHEHADHFHLESLQTLLQGNPGVLVICNPGVSALLTAAGIEHAVVTDGSHDYHGVAITGVSSEHAEIHSSIPKIQNTGYMIAGRLWYPGDAFHAPATTPEIVALPIAGPWMKLSEAIDYALAVRPKTVFPVHDWILSEAGQGVHERVAGGILSKNGITLQPMEIGKEYEF